MPHYFDREPAAPSRPRQVPLRLPDLSLSLASDAGVFGHGRVDSGTLFLLRRAPAPPAEGDLLDLGTGYGPIAVTLGLRSPRARVWGVDVNQRALELTARNAATAGAANVITAAPDDVPAGMRFAAIYSNPPVRVGLRMLHPLLTEWLDRLDDGAAAHLVVHRHLGSDSLARWLGAEGFSVERMASHDGFRILRVQARQAVGDDR
ncbi:methyltransferase [Candidatus Aeolococcus gillhamiae]|uniref:class I SAM-dependent methyltransferase n=1 Tax=Candidatus Aeolococcus gillhamiae TaxID=3127015 RepID=UPI0030772D5A